MSERKLEPVANIGAWERSVAREYKLHESWLTQSYNGEVCPCCNKVRFLGHYITDLGVCVFCSSARENSGQCQQSLFFEKN